MYKIIAIMPELNDDVLIAIFDKLNMVELMPFKEVSKGWKSVIEKIPNIKERETKAKAEKALLDDDLWQNYRGCQGCIM